MSRPWRKSSRSTNQGGACVEVAVLLGVVAVRDQMTESGL
ncbi:DUF397 domain-containing protein [Actinoallomurus purpureus]|nr:DUF397 domain-containing protein [Actinoallomurus purpureus]MCO6009780.1 DUF397 domain-containing protein [Actinoallomurus purpureus]